MASSTDRPFPSFWTLHLCGWAALGLSMWIGVLAHVDDPGRAFVGKMTFAVTGGTLVLALRPLYRWLHDRGTSIPRIVAVSAVGSYVHSFIWCIVYKGSTSLMWTWWDGEGLSIPAFGYLTSGVLFYTFIPMAWSVLYVGVKYYQDVHEERERALRAEGLAHEAQLQALRYQINPHFLFNTLNAISTLIVERNNADAERMVARLSDFLRLTLDQGTDVEVPLAEEMDFVRRYLNIQQIRFGDRLTTAFDVDAETLSACVPPLLLQPIVENAVRHGVMPRETGGTVSVEARRVGETLHLRVTDDGPGPPSDADRAASTGIGLANVRKRLDALYGDTHRFHLDRADGGGCIVSIECPFHTTPIPSDAIADVPDHTPSLPASPAPAAS